MRSKNQLMKDFKLKKLKYSNFIGKREKEIDILFNLLIKYIVPLEPEHFRFQIAETFIKIDTKINKNTVILKLNYDTILPEEEAIYSINDSVGGNDRAKKVINDVIKYTKTENDDSSRSDGELG